MGEDLRKQIRWMEQALLAEEAPVQAEEPEDWDEDEPEDALTPGRNAALDFGRALYQDEDFSEPDYVPPKQKKSPRRPVFLALLELLAILALIGWWLQWQN